MSENAKHRLGATAAKYNVGIHTLANILKEKFGIDGKLSAYFILNDEQYGYIHHLFAENLEIKKQVIELRNDEITGKIINLMPNLVDLLNLNKKLKNLSYHKYVWKESEVETLVKKFIDSLPNDILQVIKDNNLVSKEVFDKIDSFFVKEEPVLKKEEKEEIYDTDFDRRDAVEYGPYCSACQQAPCMCSDRERSSTVYDF